MPRIARVVFPNYPHHITQRGTNRTNIFLNDEDRRLFLRYLRDWAVKTDTQVWAYCLMDNHFHLLLVPKKEKSLGRCLHGMTFQYAQYYNRKYERTGRLWQNRYFSCIVDRDAYLWAVARYIERNPVRAKITKQVEDWEWSSARTHIKGIKNEILSSPDWLDEIQRIEYRRFINNDGMEEEIRKSASTGRPLGGRDFIEKIEQALNRHLRPKKGGRPKKVKQ